MYYAALRVVISKKRNVTKEISIKHITFLIVVQKDWVRIRRTDSFSLLKIYERFQILKDAQKHFNYLCYSTSFYIFILLADLFIYITFSRRLYPRHFKRVRKTIKQLITRKIRTQHGINYCVYLWFFKAILGETSSQNRDIYETLRISTPCLLDSFMHFRGFALCYTLNGDVIFVHTVKTSEIGKL